jgi:nickel-type superoxide dismutase maturation protease
VARLVAVALLIPVVALVTRVRRVAVQGMSMSPTLAPGDRLVVIRLRRARIGDLVALHDPSHPERLLVKRVTGVDPAGLEVRGDNPGASRDSRVFGTVMSSHVIGRAVYRYFPPARSGWLPRPGASSGTLGCNELASKGHRPAART